MAVSRSLLISPSFELEKESKLYTYIRYCSTCSVVAEESDRNLYTFCVDTIEASWDSYNHLIPRKRDSIVKLIY